MVVFFRSWRVKKHHRSGKEKEYAENEDEHILRKIPCRVGAEGREDDGQDDNRDGRLERDQLVPYVIDRCEAHAYRIEEQGHRHGLRQRNAEPVEGGDDNEGSADTRYGQDRGEKEDKDGGYGDGHH